MFKYSIGNHKIGKDTLIFNMGPAIACPALNLRMCQVPPKKCYALKAERQYPQVLPFRRAQARYWLNNDADVIACDIISALTRHKKIKYIRVNESGDFYSQVDVNKLIKIALITGVMFYVYTARKDLDFSDRPDNLIINGSGFMVDNNFCYEAKKARLVCPGNCRICNLCKRAGHKLIKVKAH
jgi:hypothetical protein